mgnify:CR=1 FL=1
MNKGQITLPWLIGIGVSILLASAASFSASSNNTNEKVGNIRVDVGKLQAESFQYQKNFDSINARLDKQDTKLDMILKQLK